MAEERASNPLDYYGFLQQREELNRQQKQKAFNDYAAARDQYVMQRGPTSGAGEARSLGPLGDLIRQASELGYMASRSTAPDPYRSNEQQRTDLRRSINAAQSSAELDNALKRAQLAEMLNQQRNAINTPNRGGRGIGSTGPQMGGSLANDMVNPRTKTGFSYMFDPYAEQRQEAQELISRILSGAYRNG